MSKIEAFANREAAAEAAASAIADALIGPGPKTFAATGGTTPGPAYDRLSHRDLGWERITVALTDERFVDPRNEESNERLLRARLITGQAAAARLIPLKGAGPTPQADAAAAEPKIRAVLPFAKPPCCWAWAAMATSARSFRATVTWPPGLIRAASDCASASLTRPTRRRSPESASPSPPCCGADGSLSWSAARSFAPLIEQVLSDPATAPPIAAILQQTEVQVRVLWA